MTSVPSVIVAIKVSKRTGVCRLKIKCIDQKLQLRASDIDLFFVVQKDRGENDSNNKKREEILCVITNDNKSGFYDDPTYGHKWTDLKDRFGTFLKTCFEDDDGNMGKSYDEIVVERKGGRTYNFDFTVRYKKDGQEAYVIKKLEFKKGKSVESLPQILSIPVGNKEFDILPQSDLYSRVFYDRYLSDYVKLHEDESIVVPCRQEYEKHIVAVKPATPFFRALYDADNRDDIGFKTAKNAIVKTSISEYLAENVVKERVAFDVVQKKLQDTQSGKTFVMWNGKEFVRHAFEADDFRLTGDLRIARGNTVVFETVKRGSVSCLLRWKNRMGVMNPAWQISYSSVK